MAPLLDEAIKLCCEALPSLDGTMKHGCEALPSLDGTTKHSCEALPSLDGIMKHGCEALPSLDGIMKHSCNTIPALVKERSNETASKVTIVLAQARANVDAAYIKRVCLSKKKIHSFCRKHSSRNFIKYSIIHPAACTSSFRPLNHLTSKQGVAA